MKKAKKSIRRCARPTYDQTQLSENFHQGPRITTLTSSSTKKHTQKNRSSGRTDIYVLDGGNDIFYDLDGSWEWVLCIPPPTRKRRRRSDYSQWGILGFIPNPQKISSILKMEGENWDKMKGLCVPAPRLDSPPPFPSNSGRVKSMLYMKEVKDVI